MHFILAKMLSKTKLIANKPIFLLRYIHSGQEVIRSQCEPNSEKFNVSLFTLIN